MNDLECKNENILTNIETANEYKLLMENTIDCIWVFDLGNHRFKYISPSIFKLRGLTVEEAMNEKLEESMTPESFEKNKSIGFDRYLKFMAGDRSENIVSSVDEYQPCKDGTIKIIEISTKYILNEQTNSIDILGVSRDITERKKLEKKLHDELKQKEEALRKLGSGIQIANECEKCRIYFFGKFLVYGKIDDLPIKWRTSKSEELFAFLLHNKNKKVLKCEICEALWPECSFDKMDGYLHPTIYKMKTALHNAGIEFNMKFRNGSYIVHLPKIYCDIVEFKEIVENSSLQYDEQTISQHERALTLYKNDYMEGNDYFWAISKREQYREQFHSIAKKLAGYYMAQQDYDDAKRVILKILENNELNEDAHEMLLKVYLFKKDRCSFLNHYDKMKELLFTELGVTPRESVKVLYKSFYTEKF